MKSSKWDAVYLLLVGRCLPVRVKVAKHRFIHPYSFSFGADMHPLLELWVARAAIANRCNLEIFFTAAPRTLSTMLVYFLFYWYQMLPV